MRSLSVLVGYRSDRHLSAPRRAVLLAAFVASVVLVIVVTRLSSDSSSDDVRVIRSLDEHTRHYAPDVVNSIPSFLELPGALGIAVTPSTPGSDAVAHTTSTARVVVTPLSERELLKGFCTASLAHLVRQRYPGSYDDFPDVELEQLVLKKHPEYRDRLCVLPAWIDATPLEIVKYDTARLAGPAFDTQGWARAAIAAAMFAFAALNVYYRLIVVRSGSATPHPASTHS